MPEQQREQIDAQSENATVQNADVEVKHEQTDPSYDMDRLPGEHKTAEQLEAEKQAAEQAEVDRVRNKARATNDPSSDVTSKQMVLVVEHLHKEFGDNVVLEDISFEVTQGEVIVIIGPSGCGKSTLLRCLNGLEEIQGGSVKLHGEVVDGKKKDIAKVRQKLGMVFQNYELFPHKKVIDNIMLSPLKVQRRNKAEVEKEAMALLERVGLAEKRDAFPRELSGGQKQRVAIARALAMKPQIMLMDEVTAALDPEMVREVLDVILDLAREGKTMLIVTHEMSFARAVADRIFFMDHGAIMEENTPDEFFDHPRTERAKRFLHTFEFDSVR